MSIEYLGLSEINGPLIVLEGVRDAFYEEVVEFVVEGKKRKKGKIVALEEDKAVIQVFDNTDEMSLRNTHTRLSGHPMEIGLSLEILGRAFNGLGEPVDGLGRIKAEAVRDVNGLPLNPCMREYPRNYIQTGISAIDALTTLIRGQKLPIFSGNGLPHDQLAAQIVEQASLAEAMREVSASKGEIPSRKGYPGYLYSELAALYERAGIVQGREGSVTQIPILTMPNDDITHPIPDLTGYITEGQIVLERSLHQKNVYPPINVLPSLSRLMKDGIGAKYTREDHQDLANQLFSSYARVGEARDLASVIGEDELSDTDKKYLQFGGRFEQEFVAQGTDENRSIEQTLDIGWELLRVLPKEELDRIDTRILEKYYRGEGKG